MHILDVFKCYRKISKVISYCGFIFSCCFVNTEPKVTSILDTFAFSIIDVTKYVDRKAFHRWNKIER